MLTEEKRDWLFKRNIVIVEYSFKYILLDLSENSEYINILFIERMEKHIDAEFVSMDNFRKILFKWRVPVDV